LIHFLLYAFSDTLECTYLFIIIICFACVYGSPSKFPSLYQLQFCLYYHAVQYVPLYRCMHAFSLHNIIVYAIFITFSNNYRIYHLVCRFWTSYFIQIMYTCTNHVNWLICQERSCVFQLLLSENKHSYWLQTMWLCFNFLQAILQ